MTKDLDKTLGLKSLIEKYRRLFRTPENLNHYSTKDLKEAERKFLKFSLFGCKRDRDSEARGER